MIKKRGVLNWNNLRAGLIECVRFRVMFNEIKFDLLTVAGRR